MRAVIVLVLFSSSAAFAAAEDRQVPEFDSVSVCCGIRATIQIGPTRPVHIEGDPESLAALETVVEQGRLQIRFRRNTRISGIHEGVRATIQTPALREVAASGGSEIEAQLTRNPETSVAASGGSIVKVRGIEAGALAIDASGGSVLTVNGRADELDLQLYGGSELHGKDLAVKNVRVQGSGGSRARMRASGQVRGGLSGGSELRVTGGAQARVNTSGGSSVELDD
jgi:hypothetical protein